MRGFLARLSLRPVPRLECVPAAACIGRRHVLFRGYVANAKALAAELRMPPNCRPASEDTGALFGSAAERWGAELTRHVLGEYALAVYDATERSVLLAHDTLGVVPLFYCAREDGIVFGTHLEDLVAETGVGSLDEDYVADHLARNLYIGERTPFAHIRRLRPGESVVWRNGTLSSRMTWPLADIEPLGRRDAAADEERFRRLVDEAVKAAIPAQGTVWCELSGGLDSSTVLSFAARAAPSQVEAVSFVYPRSYAADERKWIRAALKDHPVRWHPIDGDSAKPFSELPAGFVAEPNDRLVTQAVNRLYDGRLSENGVPIVLTGQGGDAVFFGDGVGPYFLADLLRTGRLGRLYGALHDLVSSAPGKRSMGYWFTRYAWRPMLRHRRRELVEDFFHRTPLPSWLSPAYAERMDLTARRRRSYVPGTASTASTSCLERVLAVVEGFNKHNNHPDAAAEFRHPLLYRPLIEFMLGLPWDRQFSPECDRALQRRALTGMLPRQILRRADKGARDQIFYEGLEASRSWQEFLTAEPRIVQRGYADGARWRMAVQQACLGRATGISDFLASVTLEAWLRQLDAAAGRRSSPLQPRQSSEANDLAPHITAPRHAAHLAGA
jgi:asparagine synthase (glutamine-hydrolysing)